MHFEYFLIRTDIPLFLEQIHVLIPKKQLAVVCAEVSGANESGLTLCPFVWISGQTLEVILNSYTPPPPHVLHTHGYHEVVVSALKSSFTCQNQSLFEGSRAGELKRGQENNPAPDGLLLQYQRQITCSSHAAADTADQ